MYISAFELSRKLTIKIYIMPVLDIQSVPGKNCLYINNHRIQETSCLNSDLTAICGPEGNILFDT